MPNKYEEIIFQKYYDLGIGVRQMGNKFSCHRLECTECRQQDITLGTPKSLWQVGDSYFTSDYRLMIIGKTARGNPESELYKYVDGSVVADCTGKKDEYHGFEDLKYKSYAYWCYTRDLANKLYNVEDNSGWEYVAFSNMVKCNNSNGKDTTTYERKNNCVGVIKSEIEYLKPKNIVFYTNNWYDEQIVKIFDDVEDKSISIVNVGKQNMSVWNFEAVLNGQIINGVRVAHPQGKDKTKFIQTIIGKLVK